MDATLYRLSIPFAIATGSAAGVLVAITWAALRESSFETPLKLLALVMSITALYHGGLLVSGSETPVLESLRIVGYGLVSIALFATVSELRRDVRSGDTLGRPSVVAATALGSLLYAVGGPLSEAFLPQLLHWIHGFAALFVLGGATGFIHDDLRNGSWDELLPGDAAEERPHAEWMVPMDDAILEVLQSSELVLTPAVVAYNIERSREEVNRRLTKLESEGLVERVERGKYRLVDRGERYLREKPTIAG